jgi:hypothetical protein
MIPHDGLIAKHMLHDIGHEKTFGKPEPYEYVEHRAQQSRERRGQVGNGSGPEPERRQDRDLVPRLCLTRAFSRDHGRSEPLRPGIDALAITAIPQAAALSVSATAIRMTPPTPATIHTPANQLYPRSSQNPPGKRLVTNIAVIHFGFLNPSLVGMRSLSG